MHGVGLITTEPFPPQNINDAGVNMLTTGMDFIQALVVTSSFSPLSFMEIKTQSFSLSLEQESHKS